ncbi:ATP-binding cassette domain-containing protein [Kitasatospora sp. YST-16]|uniref:ABC transporter ATP-binding protein n=1 Tax=Kitasatospora sp. YST-16 TaxID=2998080 RepID=UPI00228350F3|nr:ATP-binding cassette domain-containing protein [Kitasatospora sp. YST-16]WAL74671.1 ATP-binding cassette domain-containing protein [Kitasatospora sp. YST-16]WNW40726.1 ATP-binding cassette domain-containing protein [Streptomyces sp. Li-HN-5-13]
MGETATEHTTGKGLEVKDLRVAYGRGRGRVDVVNGVSFEIAPGQTLGLVGESGSGKTTIGRALLGLAPVVGGSVSFRGHELTNLPRSRRRTLAHDIQVVFQDPYSSLNPSMTIQDILVEPLRVAGVADGHARVRELLQQVGLPDDAGARYPSEFSGGQRQRIAIARALALRPGLIVCDEPTSALDLTTQAKVLDLLHQIQRDTGASYLFISHDLGVVREVSHRIAVLHEGVIVETGDSEQVSLRPVHPYTRRLQLATPVPDPDVQAQRRRRRRELLEAGA